MGATSPESYRSNLGHLAGGNRQGVYPSPAPRLVSVGQMYVPESELHESRQRDAQSTFQNDTTGVESYMRGAQYERKKNWKLGFGMLMFGLVIGLIVSLAVTASIVYFNKIRVKSFAQAVKSCNAEYYSTVAVDGSSLEMHTAGTKHPGMSVTTMQCVFDELHVPAAARQRMASTRALDGTQEETWGSYRATWNYHPENGLHVVVSVR